MSRTLWAGLAALLLALWGGHVSVAIGQTAAPAEIRLKEPIKYGSSCRRLADSREGIFKRDACNRTYCGLTDVKDIIEIRPNFAAEHACTWQLAGAECKCLKAGKP
jgi:hypothetical protein